MGKVQIIAEVGVNHNGDLDLAKKLIRIAGECGADYVKFQTFKSSALASASAEKAAYQKRDKASESQLEMLKKLELSEEDHVELKRIAEEEGVAFLSSPFDLDSIAFLQELGIDQFKIPSGELTNLRYLQKIGGGGLPVILSTGMATLDEIDQAVAVLLSEGLKQEDLSILHCVSQYPTPFEHANLKAIETLKTRYGLRTGFSDHTAGIEAAVAAVALGAEVIEKHFTLDKNMEGPDHKASLDPEELKNMISSIRNIEVALGTGERVVTEEEEQVKLVARKSIHLKTEKRAGETLEEADLEMKRPGSGISPMEMEQMIGKKLKKDVQQGALLMREDLE